MINENILSLIFFISFSIYFLIGISMIPNRKHAIKNSVFLAICFVMAIWSLAFSFASNASDYETALFWRRISAIGWGSIYSIFLHFILIITGRDKILSKKWIYVLMYLPALINILCFSLINPIAIGQYNLIHTLNGWINQSVNNYIDWFFNFYYLGFTALAVIIIVHWRITADKNMKKVARILTVSLLIAVIIGTITDIALSIFYPGEVPQIGNLIIMIPIIAIFYSINRYEILKVKVESIANEEGVILDEVSRVSLFDNITILYVLVSLMSFIALYYMRKFAFSSALSLSLSIFSISIGIQIISHLKIKTDLKDLFVTLLTSLTLPLFISFFIQSASITVWVAPVVLIMISVLFNNRKVLIIISIVALSTQIWVGIIAPKVTVTVDASDHLIRIFFFITFIGLASFINKAFVKRLEENENQTKFQKMVSQISTDFISVNKSNFEEKINRLLQISADKYNMDYSYLWIFDKNDEEASVKSSFRWIKEDSIGPIGEEHVDLVENYPWIMNKVLNGKSAHIPDISSLNSDEVTDKESLEKKQIQSISVVPIKNNKKVIGLLGFESFSIKNPLSVYYREILHIMSNIISDSLAKIQAEEEINHLAFYDALTGLPNRTLFNNRLTKEIHLAKRTEKLIGVFFIDIDSFKSINDTLGHESGDELLKQVAERLSNTVRKHDTVSRFGGDEFLIMFNNISSIGDITYLADKIMESFKAPIIIKEQEFFITASIGISTFPQDGEDAESLLKNADMAMYISKEQGKNTYTLSTPILKDDILKKIKLTNHLYRALENNELEIYYQPQIDLYTKKIIGLEALLRWNHPEIGRISPQVFIPLAEQTGLINSIGEWVLRTACTQNVAWQTQGFEPLRMAVNLSAEQFKSNSLITKVKDILIETALDPKYLELEITESIAVKGHTNIIQMLNQLKELGVSISIDDFGTEYSSLHRLKMLPIDRIKMDMNFVQSISKSSKDDAIVRIIIQLAQSLELKVIAEGVETKSQLDFLSNQICDEIQGYYYYKPMPAVEIEKILVLKI